MPRALLFASAWRTYCVSLLATACPLDPKQISVPISARALQIPKRCRKSRSVDVAHTHTVVIPEIDSEFAPIALVETPVDITAVNSLGDSELEASAHEPRRVPREYRWFDARFWVPMEKEQAAHFHAALASPGSLAHDVANYRRETADVRAALNAWASARLVIDDVPYVEEQEPYYFVECHSSLNYLSIEVAVLHAAPSEDRPRTDCFTVAQADAALRYARAIDEAVRGERRWEVPVPELPSVFDVRLPSALRHSFVPSPRTPTRVSVELKETIRADRAWAVDFRESEYQGFRMPDGRRVVPQVGFALLDPETGATTPLTTAEAEQMGFRVEPDAYRTFWQRSPASA
jgi:hypothetical protein